MVKNNLYGERSRIPGLSQWAFAQIEDALCNASAMMPDQFLYHRFVDVEDVLNFFDCGSFTGEWTGDECGCHDDRCIGHHHYAYDECGCLPYSISEFLALRHPHPIGPVARWVTEEQLDDAIDRILQESIWPEVTKLENEAQAAAWAVYVAMATPSEKPRLKLIKDGPGWLANPSEWETSMAFLKTLEERGRADNSPLIIEKDAAAKAADDAFNAVEEMRLTYRQHVAKALAGEGIIIKDPQNPTVHYQVEWGYEPTEAISQLREVLAEMPRPVFPEK